jgi:CxxC-x17-CxxC domain-containing protein
MASYNNDRRSSGGRQGGGNFRNRGSFGGGYGGGRDQRRETFKAVCDECGNSCEVPFRPTGDKPIYCDSCFAAKKGQNFDRPERREFEPRQAPASVNTEKLLELLNTLNSKLDRVLRALEIRSVTEQPAVVEKKEIEVKVEKLDDETAEKKPEKKKVVKKPAAKKTAKKKE